MDYLAATKHVQVVAISIECVAGDQSGEIAQAVDHKEDHEEDGARANRRTLRLGSDEALE